MSGGLVGGAIGATIGFFVGGPAGARWGWMAGSVAGSLLDTRNSGPSTLDLKPQSSEYGRPIPIIYSVVAVGGNVIWAADLVEIGSAGGKGSPDATSSQATYAASFAVLVCEAAGDKTLGRIWAGPDKRLIYDPATGQMESGTVTFYTGAEDQMPDPVMEAHLGAGAVPAYRGSCYLLIDGFNVTTHDGNRIPFLTIEVGASGTPAPDTGPEYLGTVWMSPMWTSTQDGGTFVARYSGSYYGFIEFRQSGIDSTVHNWQFPNTVGYDVWDDARNTVMHVDRLMTSFSPGYDTLNMTSGAITYYNPYTPDPGDYTLGAGIGNGDYIFAIVRSAGNGGGYLLVFVDPTTNTLSKTLVVDAGDSDVLADGGFVCAGASDTFAWIVKKSGKVCTVDLTATGTTTSTLLGSLPTVATSLGFGNDYALAYDSINDRLWAAAGGGTLQYAEFSPTFMVNNGSIGTSFFQLARQPWLFTPDPGDGTPGVWLCGSRWLGIDHFMRFDPTSGLPMSWPGSASDGTSPEVDGTYVGISNYNAGQYDPANNTIVALRDAALWAQTGVGDLWPYHLPLSNGMLHGKSTGGGGLGAENYQTLAQVVTDLSERAGLTTGDIDVTALTDQVDGYAIANQVQVMDAIRTLMPVYFFDYAEDQGVAKFVKRGGAISVVIEDDSLGAQPSGSMQPADLLVTNRGMDDDLPRTLNVNYILAATNYGPATKQSKRLIGYAGSEQTLDLPLVLTDLKALEVSSVNLHNAWVERLTYTFQLPREFAYLMPTDIVGIQGYTMRITKITQTADGYFKCEAVRDDADTYTPHVIVTETPPAPGTVATASLTLLELM